MLARWMENGEPIEITRRGRVVAHLTPAAKAAEGATSKPDIIKRLRKIYGDYLMAEEETTAILDHNKGQN